MSGLLLAWYHFSGMFVFLLILISSMVLYLLMFQSKLRIISRKDCFLWSLPLMLLFGFLVMDQRLEPLGMDQVFEEETEGHLTGEITMVVEKSARLTLYLKNNLVTLSNGNTYPVDNIIVHTTELQNYRVGNKLVVSGLICKFSKPTNPGQFNEQFHYKIQNIHYKVIADSVSISDDSYSRLHMTLEHFKKSVMKVYTDILPKKEAGTLIAMLLGEKYLLDEELRQLYQENGISHVLAISGLHISLLGISFYHLLRKLRAGLIPATIISSLLMYGYGILTNFSVSTNRAVVMFVVMLLASIVGKTYDMLSAMSFSAFLILLQNPLQLFSAGFLLSFGAILGIAVLMPGFRCLITHKSSLIDGLLVSISAQLMTLPLILYFFYQLPIYSVFVNLLILPTMSALILTALTAGIIGLFSMPLGLILIGGANYILKFYELLCRLGSSLPGNLYTTGKPDTIRILLYLVLLAIFLWAVGRYKKKQLLLLPVAAMCILLIPVRHIGLRVTMLNVGQGEAIFLENATGTTYLIDGGSSDIKQVGKYRIQPFLLYQGVDCIDYAIVTHADEDHISGLTELMEKSKIRVKTLIMPELKLYSSDNANPANKKRITISKEREAAEASYLALMELAKEKGINVLLIKAGDLISDGSMRIECLHPAEDYPYNSANSYSTTLSVTYGSFGMLLTGDLERDGEKLVMDYLTEREQKAQGEVVIDYDILKIAHHGSRNSTGEDFLTLVKPEYALISAGKDNRYQHPHPELLERLDMVGSEAFITTECGAITVRTDGEKMEIYMYKIN